MPTSARAPRRMWAISRVVVVLPLTPVTATIGIRPFSPSGNSERRSPRRPAGASRTTARGASAGRGRRSPRPRRRLAPPAAGRCRAPRCRSRRRRARRPRGLDGPGGHVGMDLVGDVGRGAAGAQMLTLRRISTRDPAGGTDSGVYPCSASTARATGSKHDRSLSGVAWSSPRRGSRLTCSTSSAIVDRPSPMTCAARGGRRRRRGRPRPAARWSAPAAYRSTRTPSSPSLQRCRVSRHRPARGSSGWWRRPGRGCRPAA